MEADFTPILLADEAVNVLLFATEVVDSVVQSRNARLFNVIVNSAKEHMGLLDKPVIRFLAEMVLLKEPVWSEGHAIIVNAFGVERIREALQPGIARRTATEVSEHRRMLAALDRAPA